VDVAHATTLTGASDVTACVQMALCHGEADVWMSTNVNKTHVVQENNAQICPDHSLVTAAGMYSFNNFKIEIFDRYVLVKMDLCWKKYLRT